MKTLKELYTIFYDSIKDETYIYGLCERITCLYYDDIITEDEQDLLRGHFTSQKSLHPEFMTDERNWRGGVFWWTLKEDSNPINRIAFVKKLMDTVE